MNNYSAPSALARLHDITQQLNTLQQDMAAVEQQASIDAGAAIDSLPSLGSQLNARRKALGIDLLTLELQTGISASTLKRLFKDPAQVKFGSVYAVAEALGVRLCAAV